MAIELQHKAQLLAGSGEISDVQTTGWGDPEDELIISNQGAAGIIWDR